MRPELELDPADYHLRLLIEQMQRDGRSEATIKQAVRIASNCEDQRPYTVQSRR
jgi:hypothetical protein